MDSSSPQPFPLSTLAEVPIEYIIEQLRNMAPYYWEKPETADCTIIVPIPYVRRRPASTSESSKPPKFRHSVDFHPSATGGRVTESSLNNTPRLTFKLHMDYLSAHSSYLRALLSGACAMDLINSTASSSSESTPHYSVPPDRLPKLLSSINEHPVLYLPVPDPTSFHLIVHWMYFNQIDVVSEALHDGSIQWEGIARNVEYLGLSADIKFFLKKWYHTWLDPSGTTEDEYLDSGSETDCSDSGDGDESTHTAVDIDEGSIMTVGEKEPLRGRDRNSRSLSTLPLASRTPSRR
ncbi:hypothetical protein AGABI1DRAFT_68331 [Agaricus bisporus var. burnettii JB137-S8]|uniref:BTB domain-containing protein n=1 Tax=Agaricus bisporus var. burnettii (strain JB137-S8 / ATCC MYA-4627 / FGSC 10392) TaxID=597362 RepID=K5XH57_AGABU|nr:uncharacterized protein AGABI1DRAFT_68331 [Agaricus bisporus var. burnettii JB137-S8]EKM82577.1 hypothetical protein AGABI1DRAFT_68331 [Agaricus bisporus var. burnettii JB137-S8]